MDFSMIIRVTHADGKVPNATEQCEVKCNSRPHLMNLFPL